MREKRDSQQQQLQQQQQRDWRNRIRRCSHDERQVSKAVSQSVTFQSCCCTCTSFHFSHFNVSQCCLAAAPVSADTGGVVVFLEADAGTLFSKRVGCNTQCAHRYGVEKAVMESACQNADGEAAAQTERERESTQRLHRCKCKA